MSEIAKLGPHELKQVLKLHASYIYAWANETKPHQLPTAEGKEALLDVTARMYECLEALSVHEPQKKLS